MNNFQHLFKFSHSLLKNVGLSCPLCAFRSAAELYPVPPRPETCGRTEEMIGRWLQARGCRDKVVLATKVMGGSKVSW